MNANTADQKSPPTWFMTTIVTAIAISALWFGRGFLIPLAITGLLFILSAALVDKCARIRIAGWSPPGWMSHLMSAAIVIGAIFLFGLIVSSSADEVQDALPRYEERLSALADQFEAFVGPTVVEAARGAVAQADFGEGAAAIANQLSGALSMIALVALYLAFLMSERLAWVEKLPRLAATEAGTQRARKVLLRISNGIKQYMWVNAVTSAMSGVVAFAIFSWVGLDFAPLLALTVFIVGFIPNIGAFIGIALPCTVALIQFDTLTPFLIVLIGYGLSDQIIANVIQPSMQGRSLNMSTFMVMVSLTFWATLWGGIGAFLAIPMMVVTMVVCAEIPAVRWVAVLLSTDGLLEDDQSLAEEQTQGSDKANLAMKGRSSKQAQAEFQAQVEKLRSDFENSGKSD